MVLNPRALRRCPRVAEAEREGGLNNLPRKILVFESPGEALNKYLCKRNFALINCIQQIKKP